MKLILKYMVTDGCTYNYDIILPLEYESIEKAEFDFLELCEKHFEDGKDFEFAQHEFNSQDFYYYSNREKKQMYSGPKMYSLETWFNIFNKSI